MVTQVIASGGDFQQQFTGVLYDDPMQVRVVVDGVGTAGIFVTFRLPAGVGVPSASFGSEGFVSTTVTGVGGYVQSPTFLANNYVGQFHPTCELRDTPATFVTYSQTNKERIAELPSSISAIDGNNQSAAFNTAFGKPLKVQVFNQYGEIYRGAAYSVTFTIQAGRGTFPGATTAATVTTDTNGIATSPVLTAGTLAGAFTVTASGTGVTSVTFNATAINPAVATSMRLYSGNAQKAAPSTAFGAALKVQVQNGVGGPVAGVVVAFTAPASGATCTFPGTTINGTTDAAGIAASSIPTASATAGSYNVTASSAGIANSSFSLQNGNTYGAEVCTAFIVTGGGVNTTVGQVGAAPSAWSNPASCIAAAGSGSFARNFEQPPNTNRSQGLQPSPIPANWSAVPDDAKITQIKLSYTVRGVNTVGTFGQLLTSFVGAPGGGSIAQTGITTGFTTFTRSFAPPVLTLGAALKVAGVGWVFNNAPSSNTGTSTGFDVNGVTVSVCYQPVDKPLSGGNVPLLFCEA